MKRFFINTLLVSVFFLCISHPAYAKINGVVGTFTDTSSIVTESSGLEEVEFNGVKKQAKKYTLSNGEKVYNASGVSESEDIIKNPKKTAYCSEEYMVFDMDFAVKSGDASIYLVPNDNIHLSGNGIPINSDGKWHHIRAVIQPGTRYGCNGNTTTYAKTALYCDGKLVGNNNVNVNENYLYTEKEYKFRVEAGSDGAELYTADFKVWATNDEVDGKTEIPAAPDPDPSSGEEVVYGFEFNNDGDTEGWKTAGTATTDVKDGIAKFSLKNNAWIENKTTARYDGGEVYKLVMRARITNAAKPTDSAMPYVRFYYTAYAADGSKLNQSEARKYDFTYANAVQKGDGTFDSDWAEYEIDLSSVTGFSTAKSIEDIRLDILKNSASGTVEIDYIRLYSLPGISKVTYNGQTDVTNGVPCKPESIEIELTQPIYSATDKNIMILDEDGGKIQLSSVSYESENKKIVLKIADEMLSSTKYTIVLTKDVKVTKNQSLYKEVKASFKTQSAVIDFDEKSNEGNKPVISVRNDSGEADNIYLATTYWLNNKYIKKTIDPITFTSSSEDFQIDCSGEGYNRAEVSLLKVIDGRIISIGSRVFKYEKN